MANGKLGAGSPPAETYTTLYTVPAGTSATFNLSVLNRGSVAVLVRVALSVEVAIPAPEDFIEFNAGLEGLGAVLERTGLVASAGEKIMVWASAANVTFRAHGIEQETA